MGTALSVNTSIMKNDSIYYRASDEPPSEEPHFLIVSRRYAC